MHLFHFLTLFLFVNLSFLVMRGLRNDYCMTWSKRKYIVRSMFFCCLPNWLQYRPPPLPVIPLTKKVGMKKKEQREMESQGADSPPLPLRVAKTGKNHLNEEPSSSPGICDRFSQTISTLGHAALLRR
jgi:hypothetical protein